jgi:hypothetical protein
MYVNRWIGDWWMNSYCYIATHIIQENGTLAIVTLASVRARGSVVG